MREERPKIECDSARVVRVLVKRGQFGRRRRRAGSTFYCRRFITAMAGGSQVTATRLWCSIGLKRARIHAHTKFLNLFKNIAGKVIQGLHYCNSKSIFSALGEKRTEFGLFSQSLSKETGRIHKECDEEFRVFDFIDIQCPADVHRLLKMLRHGSVSSNSRSTLT